MTISPAWCTNWDAYEFPQLWEMVSEEDNKEAWDQVQVWFRLRDAVEAQRQRLYACRQALQDQWPPETSPASAAFISYLDQLIASMTETATSAESTAHGLAGILQALATAKAELEPLRDEWLFADTDLVPRWMNHEEDDINAKARKIMITMERAVGDYTTMIKIPTRYEPAGYDQTALPIGPIGTPGQDSAQVHGGVLPAPQTSMQIPPLPHDPPAPIPGVEPLIPGTGPVLSDAPAPVMVPPTSPAPGVPVNSGTGLSGSTGNVPVTPVAGPLPGYGVAGGSRSSMTGNAHVGGPGSGTQIVPPAPQPAAPSARPATSTAPGRPAVPGAPAMTPGFRPTGAPPGVPNRPGAATSYRTPDGHLVTMSGRKADERPGSDPDDPWAVNRGVAPLIAPSTLRPHDPGPGIIGMNR